MERIAPLAKILAEANGIDWQHLQGSGEGGQIVEQDILTHLARIMTGEEEPPPTPVDAPPPDWNGQDIPGGGMFSADMLSKAGVDSDIAAFVEQTRPGADVAAPVAPAETVNADDEEMEFELDEEETPAPVVADPVPAPIAISQPAQPVAASAPVAAPTPASAPPVSTPPASGGAAAGLGSLLSRLYKTSPAAETPAQPGASAASAATTETPAPVQPAAPVMAPTPTVQAPAVQDTPTVEPVPAVHTPAATVPVADAPVEETPAAAAEVQAAAPAAPALSPAQEPVAPQPEPVVPSVVQPAAPAPAAVQPVQDATWFGVYLRRDASLGAVTDLRAQLSDALGQDVPLALLVARAAQRHSSLLGLGSVALHDGQRTRSVNSGHLRDALQGLDTDHTGTPDLLIVDAGARDLDDLHFPHTLTLSIGRVQDGRAALSLNGNVDTAQAAQFLADLAGTLERPIVLVL
ncbi:E3 binding domain-containing protein [Deinococcus deserti]|uniref:Peripheral subunit-binding (PSBD) domain-containing protein n=1 Tax=Deinococcus deserti (strain DSM 17065 / CIP 109153 / LMG 22923 / VCD115) TaxID=546414 RepID=C1CXM9_DEIDV|nr:E3 binding domain-containing protein [Deinococcus deserti]ACO44835.1 hypothetical protein Deide_00370 [Deinococcus deserti VCD115]